MRHGNDLQPICGASRNKGTQNATLSDTGGRDGNARRHGALRQLAPTQQVPRVGLPEHRSFTVLGMLLWIRT